MIYITIVEDSFDAREGFRYLLSLDSQVRIVGSFDRAETLIANKDVIDRTDIVLMDIELPGMNGIEATRILSAMKPEMSILILTIFAEREKIVNAIQAGAKGYLLKNNDPRDLLSQIKSVHSGGSPLSPLAARTILEELYEKHETRKGPADYHLTHRELEVCRLIVEGDTYREISEKLSMASATAKKHILNIYRKLDVNSRVTFMKKVFEENLLE